jgi:hypothetical protein
VDCRLVPEVLGVFGFHVDLRSFVGVLWCSTTSQDPRIHILSRTSEALLYIVPLIHDQLVLSYPLQTGRLSSHLSLTSRTVLAKIPRQSCWVRTLEFSGRCVLSSPRCSTISSTEHPEQLNISFPSPRRCALVCRVTALSLLFPHTANLFT